MNCHVVHVSPQSVGYGRPILSKNAYISLNELYFKTDLNTTPSTVVLLPTTSYYTTYDLLLPTTSTIVSLPPFDF